MRHDGAYRRLMGAQAQERGIFAEPHAPAARAILAPAASGTPDGDDGEAPDSILRAGHVSWGATIAALMGFIAPWRWRLGAIVTAGIGRVAAYHRRRRPQRSGRRRGEARPCPSAHFSSPLPSWRRWPACCTGSKSWMAHDMAYRLLAEMRIALFAKLDALAPAYLLRRRSGDLVGLATQDVETIEYFFAHTVAPAIVAVLVPLRRAGRARRDPVADGAGAAAVPAVRRPHAGLRAPPHRPARRRGARRPWAASARMSPTPSRAWPSSSPSRRSRAGAPISCARRARLSRAAPEALRRSFGSSRRRSRWRLGLGGLCVALTGGLLAASGQFAAGLSAASHAAGGGGVPAGVRDRLCQPPACRHLRLGASAQSRA